MAQVCVCVCVCVCVSVVVGVGRISGRGVCSGLGGMGREGEGVGTEYTQHTSIHTW